MPPSQRKQEKCSILASERQSIVPDVEKLLLLGMEYLLSLQKIFLAEEVKMEVSEGRESGI